MFVFRVRVPMFTVLSSGFCVRKPQVRTQNLEPGTATVNTNPELGTRNPERHLLACLLLIANVIPALALAQDVPALRIGAAADSLTIDGFLREPAWMGADLA